MHSGRTARVQSCEQYRGFHLCARNGHRELERSEHSSFYFQRKVIVVSRVDGCAKPPQWFDDALHWPAG